MDCLTYRRIKLAAPQDASHEVIAHAHACRECAAFTRQLEAFEQDLHTTLHVPVSEGLAEKIILRRSRPQWFRTTWLPVAAAIVITVAALVTFDTLPSRNSFALQFVNHVLSEPNVVGTTAEVEPTALRLAFANFGGQLQRDIGEVQYVKQCKIGGVDSTHVQISTRSGDAALLLRPGRRASIDTPEVLEGHAVVLVSVPRGSLAIVAATPKQASEIRSLVLASSEFHG
jgi:hypothetical protein